MSKNALNIGRIAVLMALLMSVVFILLPVKTEAATAWYNSAWQYRKSFTMSHAVSIVTNYPMPILVYYGSGSDNNTSVYDNMTVGSVYLNGHSKTDFSDVLFTQSDGVTKLPQWTENYTASSVSLIWVNYNSIGTSATTFYIYYGNASATSSDNGTATFSKFDNFEWGINGENITDSLGGLAWSKAVAGTSSATISTAQSDNASGRSGNRSLQLFRNGANDVTVILAQPAATNSYAISLRIRKDNNMRSDVCNGDGAKAAYLLLNNDNSTNYYDGSIVSFGTSIPSTWNTIELNAINFISGTFNIVYNGSLVKIGAGIATTSIGALYLLCNGGTGNVYFDNIFIRNWSTTQPIYLVWGLEESVATNTLAIQDCKIFSSYKTSGDWLITCRYLNTYAPYYPNEDVRRYFAIQLLDSSNTILASHQLSAWGNRVGSIYLSPSLTGALNLGGAYKVRIQALFSGSTYVEYTLLATDWLGSDLSLLDAWSISSANVLATYDTILSGVAKTYVANIATRGSVLSSSGGELLSSGCPGLQIVRPTLFQIYTAPTTYTPTTGTATFANSARSGTAAAIGPDAVTAFQRLGQDALGGLPYNYVIAIVAVFLCFGIAAATFPFGHTTVANTICLGILFAFGYFGFDWIWIIMIYIVAVFLLAKKLWIDTGI
jgi:hypothetical protein